MKENDKSEKEPFAARFLMCPPDYYKVAYEINPWMSVRRPVHHRSAVRQWQVYYELLTGKLKAHVELIEPQPGLPDMVFTANAGLVQGRLFIKSNFRHKERRGEEPFYETWFRKKGYTVKHVPRPLAFEGEGDAFLVNGELFTGYHFRSDVEAHEIVSSLVGMPYQALELADKYFYHLDTCFAPLNDKTALAYLPAFAPYAQKILLEVIEDLIRVPQEEARRFACNMAVVGRSLVIPEGCPITIKELEKRGFQVYALDFTEFIKAGGASKCLVLRL